MRKEATHARHRPDDPDRWRALAIVDRDRGTVGSISELYLDRETRRPTWALINIDCDDPERGGRGEA